MSVREQWEAAGRITVLLPSGFRVRGVMPSPTEIVRRRIVPWALRQATAAMGGSKMSDLSEDQHAQLVEARRFQLAAFLREIAAPGTEGDDGFEAVEFTVDELGALPPNDLEALDDLIMGIKTAEQINAQSALRLGMLDRESAERIQQEEEGDTPDGWAGFREESGGSGAGDPVGAVEPEAEQHAARPASTTPRAAAGRRSGAAAARRTREARTTAGEDSGPNAG
jgi:hypothetical protein